MSDQAERRLIELAYGEDEGVYSEIAKEAVRLRCERQRAPATPPSDETPAASWLMQSLEEASKRAALLPQRARDIERAHAAQYDRQRAPLVDTGGPTATNVSESPLEPLLDGRAVRFVLNDEGAKHAVASMVYRAALDGGLTPSDAATVADGVFTSFGNEGTDRGKETVLLIKSIVQATKDALVAVRSPSPEGTGTPPTPSELPSQPELGVGVAGELPGVGAADGVEPNRAWHEKNIREYWAKLIAASPPSDVLGIVHVLRNSEFTCGRIQGRADADREIARLRLRAEAAERRVGTLETALRDLDKLRAQIELRASLSSQRTL